MGGTVHQLPFRVLAISKLTSIKTNLQVKRKTKALSGIKTVWWFIVHAQESDLSALDAEWENVQLQAKWSLERCFMPSSVNGIAAPLPQHNTTGNTNPNPDKRDAQETSTGPISSARVCNAKCPWPCLCSTNSRNPH